MAQEKTYEMQWDCQFCGTNKLLGKTHRFCPSCGAPQNPDARYFPADDEKVAVEDHEFVGRDKICPACGGLNAGNAAHCGNCGSPLDAAAIARTLEERSAAEGEGFESSGPRDVMQEQFEREMAAAGVETPKAQAAKAKEKQGGSRWLLFLIPLVLVCGSLIFLFTRTQDQTVVAAGHNWEREVRIEEYQAVREGDWQSSVPSAAYDRSCSRKQSDTRRVPDGETCRTVRRDNGDGTFTERQECETKYREEPVYDTWCDYKIDKWAYGRSVTTTGEGLSPAPNWGEIVLNCEGSNRLGCEREAEREETYRVIFNGDGETYECTFPQSEWETVAIESTWTVKVRQFIAGDALCDTLEAR